MAASSARVLARVTSEPLNLDDLVTFVSDPGAGAISTFSGVTRNNFEGKNVLRLEYEAYEQMAVKKLKVSTHALWQLAKTSPELLLSASRRSVPRSKIDGPLLVWL